MAEGILSNIAAKILVSLAKHAHQEVVSCWGAQADLRKLEGTLRFIRARIHDAETRHEEESSETIKELLGRLRQVLYQADDLFDDVSTLSCRQQRAESSNLTDKVRIMLSSSNPVIVRTKIAQEIKAIRKALDDIKSGMDGLNLRGCFPHQETMSRSVLGRETISFVKADSVIGRENDKIKILDMLFDPKYAEKDVSVIPIVGFGGFGKTTLAQIVFNDERIQKHFDIAKWACIPDIDNQKEVFGKTLRALSGTNYLYLSMEEIQSQLREAVRDKKFFLVIDDVWDESRDRWLELFGLLQCAIRGSKIIVTTRSDVVATNVGTVPTAYKLGLLEHEDSWNLFKKLAFKEGQEESNPNFTQIGREIVKNCGNVPLAIRVVGSLLYPQHTEKEWEVFRKTLLSKAKVIDLSNIMPVLKLSYDYLPQALKPCYAYCSLFPKDYHFKNTELVSLWMAEGYLEPLEESLGMEDTGEQYFLELLRRNFFQDVEEDELSNGVSFRMHDLIHDLAQRVHFPNRLVHVNVCPPGGKALTKQPSSLLDEINLRSLLLNFGDPKMPSLKTLVSGFGSLRVLECFVGVVPDSIGRLRHLRYLNFSNSYFTYLPRGITRLDNLQTLKLNHCRYLEQLPRGFTKLLNLRHLGIRHCPLTEMPLNIGKMKSLREINRFIIGENNGLDALSDLNLQGELVIAYRKWRTNAIREARMANLKEKKHLISLSFFFEYSRDATQDEGLLLESLQLPPSLKSLYFSHLKGNRFPRWMLKESPRLVEIRIQWCDSCQVLPLFSRLPLLKNLYLDTLQAVEYVEEGVGESGSSTYFPALKSLTLRFMRELKSFVKLEDGDKLQHYYVFPRLKILEIFHCPKLTSFPSMPNLESLTVESIQEQLLESILTLNQTAPSSSSSTPTLNYLNMERLELTSVNLIKKLVIRKFGNLRNTSDVIRCLPVLEELQIVDCDDLDAWGALEGLNSLRSLRLLSMAKVELLPDWITCLTMLQKLNISCLKNLNVLPHKIGNLSRLESLSVYSCPKLTSLPQSLSALTCLQQLVINRCPDLEKQCDPNGQDWPLIQHIPNVFFG